MAFKEVEKKALREKFENTGKKVVCPNCGALLQYRSFDTAEEVFCPTKGCLRAAIRGI